MHPPAPALTPALTARRRKAAALLADAAPGAVGLVLAGAEQPRNYRANAHPFRASSHALYLCGALPAGAALLLDAEREGGGVAFIPVGDARDALWHGPSLPLSAWAAALGVEARPLEELAGEAARLGGRLLGLPQHQQGAAAQQGALLGREAEPRGRDLPLAHALVESRLTHDAAAVEGLREAARLTAAAHAAGRRCVRELGARLDAGEEVRCHEVRAAMEEPLTRAGATPSYIPIITPHGEVLHQHDHSAPLRRGDLLLVDFGAETAAGWAGDVTRVWPVGERMSPTQRALYDVVHAALRAATAEVRPGAEYRHVHLRACLTLAEGLRDVGILKVGAEEAVARNAHALFFPHGVGHLLGLDVHDMEDLGDVAGYAPGRARDERFGWGYLRLDRPLREGMAVTVEPGFYQVEALLRDPSVAGPQAAACVDWGRLEMFGDVRGVRLEDDVLVTAGGAEVLSGAVGFERG
ncbi:MAG: M24 family metallopeptidase [Deltaproteobacteria bacterium]|jgi:Xaa-Pro aminopeptidase|nr:M24 family metallopeptidase [Deltaproteobacteria bacterium]